MRFQKRKVVGPAPPGRGVRLAARSSRTEFRLRRPFSNSSDEASYEEQSPDEGFRTDASLPGPEAKDTSPGGADQPDGVNGFRPTPRYTITNLTTDRTYDANGSSVAELADVLGTFINDVNSRLQLIEQRLRNA